MRRHKPPSGKILSIASRAAEPSAARFCAPGRRELSLLRSNPPGRNRDGFRGFGRRPTPLPPVRERPPSAGNLGHPAGPGSAQKAGLQAVQPPSTPGSKGVGVAGRQSVGTMGQINGKILLIPRFSLAPEGKTCYDWIRLKFKYAPGFGCEPLPRQAGAESGG